MKKIQSIRCCQDLNGFTCYFLRTVARTALECSEVAKGLLYGATLRRMVDGSGILLPLRRVELVPENRNHVIIVGARIVHQFLKPRIECGVICERNRQFQNP
jgi:hypothetical protein